MPRQTISQAQWAMHKREIERLYIDERRTLSYIRDHLQNAHGFEASKSQYETQFGKWNLKKYTTKEIWQQLARVIESRKVELDSSEVLYNGEVVPSDKVRRELARYAANSYGQRGSTIMNPTMPEGFAVRIRDPFSASPYQVVQWHLLPSTELLRATNFRLTRLLEIGSENHLPAHESRQLVAGESPTTIHVQVDFQSTLGVLYRNEVLPSLRALYPVSLHDGRLAMADESNRELDLHFPYELAHLHMLFYRLANNMFGPGSMADLHEEIKLKDIWPYLRPSLQDRRLNFLNSLTDYHTKTIMWKLLQAATEVGDAHGVELMLTDARFRVQVNEVICVHGIGRRKYTAIELCGILCETETAKVFVDHGADVNRHASYKARGALACALDWTIRFEYARNPSDHPPISQRLPSPELVKLIIGAGATVTFETVRTAVDLRAHAPKLDIEVLRHVVFGASEADRYAWTRGGQFRKIIMENLRIPNEGRAEIDVVILQAMTAVCPNIDEFPDTNGARLIDVMARRGNLAAVEHLMQSGYPITWKTMRAVFGFDPSPSYQSEGSHYLFSHAPNPSLDDLSVSEGSLGHNQRTTAKAAELPARAAESRLISEEQALITAIQTHNQEECMKILQQHTGNRRLLLLGPYSAVMKLRDGSRHALFCALSCNNQAMARVLLDWGAFRPYETPTLLKAAYEAHYDYAVDFLSFHRFGNMTPAFDYLEEAVLADNLGLVECLIKAGTPLDRGGREGATLLCCAVTLGSVEMIQFLLNEGVSPYDEEALQLATKSGNENIITVLTSSMSTSQPALKLSLVISVLDAALAGRPALVKFLLSHGLNLRKIHMIESEDLEGLPKRFEMSLLGRAIWKERNAKFEALRTLLHTLDDRKTQLNQIVGFLDHRDHRLFSETPLLLAIRGGRSDMVKFLIQQGADVNLSPRRGLSRTPLQQAAEFGRLEILQMLIEHGAQVETPIAIASGASALQLASIGGYCGIMEVLLQHGARINAPACEVNGRTAIEGAAEHGRIDAVKLLLDARGMDTSQEQGSSGVYLGRAIPYARRYAHMGVVELLKEYRHRVYGIPIDE